MSGIALLGVGAVLVGCVCGAISAVAKRRDVAALFMVAAVCASGFAGYCVGFSDSILAHD